MYRESRLPADFECANNAKFGRRMKAKRLYTWVWLPAIALMASCSPVRKNVKKTAARNFAYSYCTPNQAIEEPVWEDSVGIDLSSGRISEHDRLLIRELGIGRYIAEVMRLRHDSADGSQIRLLKQLIADRVRTARVELESVIAELDCEGERADLAAVYLDKFNSRRNRRYTVASVVTGALTTVVGVLILGRSGQIAVGVGGGSVSAGLALATINPKGRKIAFYHERNLLRSIWTDTAENREYPRFVWHLLHEKQLSNSGKVTLAQSIRDRWMQFIFNGDPDKKQVALLFGDGGFYHADDLHMRAAMLNQLQSTIRSINQDLIGVVELIDPGRGAL